MELYTFNLDTTSAKKKRFKSEIELIAPRATTIVITI
jgi:hypothetical protein